MTVRCECAAECALPKFLLDEILKCIGKLHMIPIRQGGLGQGEMGRTHRFKIRDVLEATIRLLTSPIFRLVPEFHIQGVELCVAKVGQVGSIRREHECDDDSLTSATWLWWGTLEGVMNFDERWRCVDLSMNSDRICGVRFPEEFVGFKMDMRENQRVTDPATDHRHNLSVAQGSGII